MSQHRGAHFLAVVISHSDALFVPCTRIVKIAEVLQGGVFVNILCLCANCLPGPKLWFISRARKKWLFEQVGAVWRAGRAGGRLGPL